MLKSIYTNTSKPSAIAGLLILTVGMAYAQSHATEIVEGSVNILKDSKQKIESKLRKGKKQYVVAQMDFDGKLYDTGKRIWK